MADDTLTPEEQAYFDTQGGDIAQEAPQPTTPESVDDHEQKTAGEAAEQKTAKDGKDRQQKLVPLPALHEERERRKDAEHRAKLLEERTNLILQRFAQPGATDQQKPTAATADAQLPDPEKDPIGYMAAQQNAMAKVIGDLAAQLQAQQQQGQQQNAQHQLWSRAAALEAEYKTENPDYDNGAAFVRSMRDKQLKAIGVSDPSQRMAMIQQEALTIANMALQNGRNPAEVIYDLATNSGYTAKSAEAPTAEAGAVQAQTDAARLQTLARGQTENASLGNVRGSPAPKMNAKVLADMKEDEFQAWMAKATPAQLREHFGN